MNKKKSKQKEKICEGKTWKNKKKAKNFHLLMPQTDSAKKAKWMMI